MTAPHLPPKACSLKFRDYLRSVPWILFSALVAALVGFSTALLAVLFVTPQSAEPQIFHVQNGNTQPSDVRELDPLLVRQTEQRTLERFDIRSRIGDGYYPESAETIRAVLLSSDGWVVMSDHGYTPGDETFWEFVDYQRVVHTAETVVHDERHGLIYAKLSGEGFRVMSLRSWDAVKEGAAVWVVSENEWSEDSLPAFTDTSGAAPSRIDSLTHRLVLDAYTPGSVVLSLDGELIGFVGDNGIVSEGWLVAHQLPELLQEGVIAYSGLPYVGQVVLHAATDELFVDQIGFYVVSAPVSIATTTVRTGDVIIGIDGDSVQAHDMARAVMTADGPVTLDMIRGEAELQIVLDKVPLQ